MKKNVAFLLVIVLLINTIPIQTFATEETSESTSTTVTPPVLETDEPEIIGECTELRDETTKHFLMNDGSFIACQYTQPIHYYADGDWKDINNSLLETNESDTNFENIENDVKIKFSNKAKKSNMVQFKHDNYQISWGIEDVDNKPKFEIIEESITENTDKHTSLKNINSSGIYSNVFDGVDFRYTIISKNIKEDIILNNKGCRNEFTFVYNLSNLEMRLTETGIIEIYDSANAEHVVYQIDKPYMYDSASFPATSNEISMELSGDKGKYTVTLCADQEWLDSDNRVYPIIIDPTLTVDQGTSNMEWRYATRLVCDEYSDDPAFIQVIDYVSQYDTMEIGYYEDIEIQGLLQFDMPKVISSSAQIIKAELGLNMQRRTGDDIQVNAHLVTSNWFAHNRDIMYEQTNLTYDSNVIDYMTFDDDTNSNYYHFDITSAVQKWDEQMYPNLGILFASENVLSNISLVHFVVNEYSSKEPKFRLTYRDNKGLEDYWTYHTQNVGRAGNGYINDYTGNLVFVHNDITTTSERMTVSLDHVFVQSSTQETNTNLNTPKYGIGWKLSAVQRLEETPDVTTRYYFPYVYTDADGTKHYFGRKGDGTYIDEDGLGLTLQAISEYTDNNQTYLNFSITTKDKIVMKFDSDGYLRRITDTNYNTISFNYTSIPNSSTKKYLSSITDPDSRGIALYYDSEYYLTSIRNYDNSYTYYEYDEKGHLVKITYSDSSNVLFTYDDNDCIDTVKNVEVTGIGRYTIDYDTYTYSPNRIRSVTEYGIDGETGQSISNIVYEHNQTKFIDNKGRTSIYQFDNWGCTTSVIDSAGNASNYSYEHTGNKNNKFSTVGFSQKNINNYIMNSSAEQDSDWDTTQTSSNGSNISGDISYSNEEAYIGNRSFRINTEAETELRVAHTQEITLKNGTYTLSAYVKTQNVHTNFNGGAAISVLYTNNDDKQEWVDSDVIVGTKEWQKLTLTFTLTETTNTVQIYIGLVDAYGTAYFDCIQLEDGEVANDYNLLQNSSFEQYNDSTPKYWSVCETTASDGIVSSVSKDGEYSYNIIGSAKASKYLSQTIPVIGNEGDIFSVSGWAKGISVDASDGTVFNITTRVVYSDGTEKWDGHDLNTCVEDWQFLSAVISTDDKNPNTQKTYTSIGVYFCYYKNENEVFIDHFQVTKDSGQSYSYDDDGNLISTVDIADKESTFNYQNNILKQLVNPDGSNYEYSYGYAPSNQMLAARSSGGVSYKFGYNIFYGYGTTDVAQVSGDKYSSTVEVGKVYYIRNRQTRKNLQPYNCEHYTGTNMVQYTPNTSQYQKWRIRDAGDNYVYLELADASTCKLGVKDGTMTTNQPLELNAEFTEAVKFKLVSNSDGIHYSIRPKLDESMAVCSNLGSTANNNQILIYPYASAGPDKEWIFVEVEQSDYVEPQTGKTYYISNYLTGQNVDGGAFYTYVGHPLTQHAYLGGTNQQFYLEPVGDYFLIVPQHCSNKAYAVGSDGESITLQERNTADTNQQFQFVALSNGAYKIIPRNYPTKCLSQQTSSAVVSQSLKILDYTDKLWQQWRFTEPIDYTKSAEPEDGEIYYIRFNHNYQYLDCTTMRSENGSALTQYPLNSMLNQQFKLVATSEGYYNVIPMHTNKNVLVTMVPNESRTDGGGYIQLYEANGSAYQEFKFVPTSNNTYRMVCRASASDAFCVEIPNGVNDFSATVGYVPFVGNGANWQWLTLEKVGDVIRTSATYDRNKNYIESLTDEAGNTTLYDFTNKGYLSSTTNAKGNTTSYTYDSSDRISSVSSGESNVAYNYYSDSALQKIISPSGTTYNFLYDSFRNIKTIRIGSKTLIDHVYNDNNGTLAQSTYGNGTKINYQYDSFDYLRQKLYNDTVITDYTYDAKGRLYKKNDYLANQTLLYEYDLANRPTSITSSDGLKQTYNYDNKNRIESYTSTIGDISQKTGFLYGRDTTFGINLQKPGYLYGVTQNGTQTLAYEYDSLSRLRTKRIDAANHYQVGYEYYQGPNNEGTSQTTTMLSTVTNGDTCWEYTYDELGNITSISKDGVVQESYTYDSLNQLKTVTRGSDVWEYSYDNGGNLTEVKQNETIVKTYTYGDSEWKDLLTTYNGHTITYDEIGNPLQYRDGYNFTWQNGRQLATITKGNDNISYTYNSDGLRISKTVNGTTTEYYWLEGSLLGQKTGDEYIIYLYDDNGTAYGMMITDGTAEAYYYYLFNAQGDIIGILDSNGTQVVEYAYSAWGENISITGTLADTIGQKNPLRYRGYYYDAKTGFYYVSSRYYDPEIGRFLNADSLISQSSVIGNNMFAYCLNNPVNMADNTGNLPFFVITAAIGAVAGAIVGGVVAAKNGGNVWAGIGIGAAAGALIGAGAGAAAGAVLAGSATASTSAVLAGGTALVNSISVGGIGAGAAYIANNISQAVSGGGGQTVSQTVQTGKNVYYQVTSSQAAQTIADTGKLVPSSVEGSVCVLNFQPTLAQARQLGAQAVETVIRFSTNCTTFVPDLTVPYSGAYRNMINGAIQIFDIVEVGFR